MTEDPRSVTVSPMERPHSASPRKGHGPESELRRFVLFGQAADAPRLAAGLYVVATPIGNLGDITLRALQILAGADIVACEDTRVSRKLLDHYGIRTPLTPYHDHNAAAARPKLIARLAAGESVALISDAGTPLVSDPGLKLVQAAREAGHEVTSAPGASAVLTALTIAGLASDRFFFEGFLPPRQAARRARIAELVRIPGTLVLFETGPRLGEALADLALGLGARQAAVCRELTKLHEEVRRGDLATLARDYAGAAETRGEIVILIAPAAVKQHIETAELDQLLRGALARLSVKDAVAEVAVLSGLSRREVYRRALALVKDADHGAPP